MRSYFFPRVCIFIVVFSWYSMLAQPGWAQLKFYYDPATGNVSFDTKETRTGALSIYFLQLNGPDHAWSFRTENSIRLSEGTFYTAKPNQIGDATFDAPWRGLYTIGDILPAGLSEEFWTTAFVQSYYDASPPYTYGYIDKIGGGFPPDAQFLYGRPAGEFKNRWDLVDPDTLTWATTAKLIYRAWNGEVLLDTTGPTSGYISAILLNSNGEFLPGGFTPSIGGPLNSATEELIGVVADAIEPGRYSIGEIVRAGLTRDEFEATFTTAMFLGRAGFNGGSLDFDTDGQPILLQYVPEPSSVALFGLAMLGGLGLRLRRSRAGHQS